MAALDQTAGRYGRTAAAVLADLHAEDFLQLDDTGQIRAAYPFSAVPTPHLVQITGGPQVHAMCAIDALGIAAMLGTAAIITSSDPRTGESVTVSVPAGGRTAVWEPATTVVFAGRRSPGGALADCTPACCPTPPAADICCGYMNFFATHASATGWDDAHPEITGQALGQAAALRLGRKIFGPLLTGPGKMGG